MAKKEEFPSNSKANRSAPIRPEVSGDTPKAERQVVVRPITKAVRRKRTIPQAIAGGLMNDAVRGLGHYVLNEIVIPTAKEMVEQIFKNSLDRILYGSESRPVRSSRDGATKISYGSYYKERERREARPAINPNDRFGLKDIFFKDGEEAGDVLYAMCEQLEQYDEVTVAEFFEMAGIEGATYTHQNWGWRDLSKARATHTRYGWYINLPEPEELTD